MLRICDSIFNNNAKYRVWSLTIKSRKQKGGHAKLHALLTSNCFWGLVEQSARDDLRLNLGGTFKDIQDTRVA